MPIVGSSSSDYDPILVEQVRRELRQEIQEELAALRQLVLGKNYPGPEKLFAGPSLDTLRADIVNQIQEERLKILNFQISSIKSKIKRLSIYPQAIRGHKYEILSKRISKLCLLGLQDAKINELKEALETTYQAIMGDGSGAASS